MANAIIDLYDGELPENLDQMVKLPGVGRKTANVVLGNVYSTSSGAFTTVTSTKTFSGNISLVDGDQLTITWVITIADS